MTADSRPVTGSRMTKELDTLDEIVTKSTTKNALGKQNGFISNLVLIKKNVPYLHSDV